MHALMTAGHRWVAKRMQKEKGGWSQLIYMDDRNITSDDPETLCRAVELWVEFSSLMGLLENMSKLRLVATDEKKKEKLNAAAEAKGYGKYSKTTQRSSGPCWQ